MDRGDRLESPVSRTYYCQRSFYSVSLMSFLGFKYQRRSLIVVSTFSPYCVSILQQKISVFQVLLKAKNELYGEHMSFCNDFLSFPSFFVCVQILQSQTLIFIAVFGNFSPQIIYESSSLCMKLEGG